MGNEALMKIQDVSKSFGMTRALRNVTFDIGRGEVRGFIGENGSGKSTLSNIVAGVYTKDSGTILMNEEPLVAETVLAAEKQGIALIVQEIGTIENITVAGNIFLGSEKQFAKLGILNYKEMSKRAKQALIDIGIDNIDPEMVAGKLNLEERKIIEIAKAFRIHPKLMIVDETSNALSTFGRTVLYETIKKVKAYGGTVLFITHDLEELVQVCDSVTILRDGVYIDTVFGADMDVEQLKVKMVGREMSDHYYRTDSSASSTGETVLMVENLFTSDLIDISFHLEAGEILGFGGLSDCGMHELGRVLFGLVQPYQGTLTYMSTGRGAKSAADAIHSGVGYISKNRDTEALILLSSIKDNICLCNLDHISKFGFVLSETEDRFADYWIDKLAIKMKNKSQFVANLSGGNKQKVVLAKWLGRGSKILIMDCPTRGIDIGVKEAIYQLMQELKAQGHAILLISEELPELIGMSDRVYIMRNGEIVSENQRGPEVTESLLIHDMI